MIFFLYITQITYADQVFGLGETLESFGSTVSLSLFFSLVFSFSLCLSPSSHSLYLSIFFSFSTIAAPPYCCFPYASLFLLFHIPLLFSLVTTITSLLLLLLLLPLLLGSTEQKSISLLCFSLTACKYNIILNHYSFTRSSIVTIYGIPLSPETKKYK